MADDMASLTVDSLEGLLDCFDPKARRSALAELVRRVRAGEVQVPVPKQAVNLHFHTFYSYNAYGWSPSRIAWEARKHGLAIAGIVDFDVLDGMEEFLAAGPALGLPVSAAMESRVFIPECADKVINSPNEPGIAYFMAGGCYKLPRPDTASAQTLAAMRDMARRRNLQVMTRVNDYLGKVQLDYESDVLPLTPSGNATERHMLAAYDAKARRIFGEGSNLAQFWAEALEIDLDAAAALLKDTPALHEKMRSKLMKFGGVGYVAPSADTFPHVGRMIEMTQGIDALPTMTWLDGTSPGESDMPALLGLLAEQGVAALNIVPDRNWNIKNPEEKAAKLENLAEVVAAAKDLHLPLCVGTELNKLGLPFVDDFEAPEMAPYVRAFIDGACFFWGHTFLALKAEMGWASEWAKSQIGPDRATRNRFYTQVGRLAQASSDPQMRLEMSPDEVIRAIQ